jgi:hypothetical protein
VSNDFLLRINGIDVAFPSNHNMTDPEVTNPMNSGNFTFVSKDSSSLSDALREIVARHPFAENEHTLEEFVDAWERGTLPKKSWTHGAHVGVAAYFAYEYPAEVLVRVMRLGIRHYNLASGGANTEDSGYHETLTRFWANQVGNLVRSGKFGSRLEAARTALARFGDCSGHFRKFYNFDVLGNRRARREWVAPDRVAD